MRNKSTVTVRNDLRKVGYRVTTIDGEDVAHPSSGVNLLPGYTILSQAHFDALEATGHKMLIDEPVGVYIDKKSQARQAIPNMNK